MKKYDSFLNIDIFRFRKILKDCVLWRFLIQIL
jgi:hypothetical protein